VSSRRCDAGSRFDTGSTRAPGYRVAIAVEEKLELTLGGGRDAPARARTALEGLEGSLADLRQPVRLLVSELVTNAVKHGGSGPSGTVELTLDCSPALVHVEVADQGPGFEPRSGHRIDPLEDGFGLALVDQLADRWGVHVDRGARVWFEIDRRGA
jgi:anti-sigma regulatory factor (Ser/Thr protein kinase)